MARFKAGHQMIVLLGGCNSIIEPRPVCSLEVSLQPISEGGATSLGKMYKDDSLSVKSIILWTGGVVVVDDDDAGH